MSANAMMLTTGQSDYDNTAPIKLPTSVVETAETTCPFFTPPAELRSCIYDHVLMENALVEVSKIP
jgi:hypothetical protein